MDLKKPSPHPAKAIIKANNISVASVAETFQSLVSQNLWV
jgi:hypothetical protein